MDNTKKKTLESKFQLHAEEIDRIMDELNAMLSEELIDRKDALRLRFLLEETVLK